MCGGVGVVVVVVCVGVRIHVVNTPPEQRACVTYNVSVMRRIRGKQSVRVEWMNAANGFGCFNEFT